jgi:Dna[CI] antecedent DciA-like protein
MRRPGPISAKPLSVLLSDVFSDAYAKQGFAARELVTRWAEIAGPEIARHSEPLKIQWPRPVEGQPQQPATLVLRVEGPMALEIQHASDAILERGGTAGTPAGAAVAPGSRPARPRTGPGIGRGSRNHAGVHRRRGTAGCAGAARRIDQAKLSRAPAPPVAADHCHNCGFKLANRPLLEVHRA